MTKKRQALLKACKFKGDVRIVRASVNELLKRESLSLEEEAYCLGLREGLSMALSLYRDSYDSLHE